MHQDFPVAALVFLEVPVVPSYLSPLEQEASLVAQAVRAPLDTQELVLLEAHSQV